MVNNELFDIDLKLLEALSSEERLTYFSAKLQYARDYLNRDNDLTVFTALTQAQLAGQMLPEENAADLADMHLLTGIVWLRNNEPEKALTHLKRATEFEALDPLKRVHAEMELACAYRKRYERDLAKSVAVESLHRFARTNPDPECAKKGYSLIIKYAEEWENDNILSLAYEPYINILEEEKDAIPLLLTYLDYIKVLYDSQDPVRIKKAQYYIEKYKALCDATPKYEKIDDFGEINLVHLYLTLAMHPSCPLEERIAFVLDGYTTNLPCGLYFTDDVEKTVRLLYDEARKNEGDVSGNPLIRSAIEASDFEQWLKEEYIRRRS